MIPNPIVATPRREPFTMLIIRFRPRDSESDAACGLLSG